MISPNVNIDTASQLADTDESVKTKLNMGALTATAASKHKIYESSHADFAVDEEAFDAAKAIADARNASYSHSEQSFSDIAGMTSTEAKIFLEQKYKPLLNAAIHQHKQACDDVTRFEDFADTFKAQERGRYAHELRHPDIIKVHCAGDVHFNHMIKSGELNRAGYKLVDRRNISLTLDGITSQKSTLVFIPDTVTSLLEYADSDQAKEHAESAYQRELQKLISKRKSAAVQLEELREEVSEKWNSITDFESMFTSNVRKGRK